MNVDPAVDLVGVAAPGRHRTAITHARGFWAIAFAFFVSMAFTAVPSPLYAIYQERLGLSSFLITVVFAAYAVGAVVSMFLVGHLSDRFGRRPLLVAGIVVEAGAALAFLVAPTLTGLVVGRIICGVGVGMVAATATAHLAELHGAARPNATGTRAELVAIAANIGGLGVGPFVSGLLAEHVGAPLHVPFLVFLVLLVAAALAVAAAPETVERRVRHEPYRPQRVTVPIAARPRYFAAAAAGFTAFSIFGLFNSLAPGFVARTLEEPSRAVAGAVPLLVFGSAAGTQMLVGRAPARRQVAMGLTLMAVGVVPVAAGMWSQDLAPFLAGGACAGAGAGVLFKGAVSTVAALATPEALGEALAGLFLAAYLGLVVPVLALGVATQHVASEVAVLGFSVGVVTLVAVVGRGLLARDAGDER